MDFCLKLIERHQNLENHCINGPKKLFYLLYNKKGDIQDNDEFQFFTFTVHPKKIKILPMIIIIAILSICLFPIWPFKLRLFIFYLSFYLLIAILLFSVIRLIIYILFRVLGYEFWILPEIFENVNL